MTAELRVPSLGQSELVTRVEEWLRPAGAAVSAGDRLVVLTTPAGPLTLSAPAAGRLARILKPPGSTAHPNEVLASIEPEDDAAGPDGVDELPLTPIRRRIAERLVHAQRTAALLSTFNEADMSAVLALRASLGDRFEALHRVRLGIVPFFVKAAVDALQGQPMLNAELRDDRILLKKHYDVGIAVATPRGLVVPVLRRAESLSFAQIEISLADLSQRAREGRIRVDELQGGTFTITDGGAFGSLLSTPIVNPPQSAILGLHAIQERPVARAGQVVIRPMMYLALTYDHRLVDGREAALFLARVVEAVEDPARLLLRV